MSTTGGSTWDAAFRLADFLELEWENLRGDKATNVLELGAGTGWLGMTLAHNVESSTVCLTEQADGGAMDWLQQNLAENVAAQLPLRSVRTEELDWNAWEARRITRRWTYLILERAPGQSRRHQPVVLDGGW
ncbi:unnamed protein product [Cladocopium goreaui]|uniref:UPF0665 family protein C23C4.06c n=1 Tax=Cladocopium goreaui TaxID=2562237 RepID=A0A9P1FUT7_9DINO|nr:unnamed protein product [Cladocopium goreaui]